MHGDGAGRKLSGYICLGGLVMLNTCPTLGTGWMHAWHAPVWGAQTGSSVRTETSLWRQGAPLPRADGLTAMAVPCPALPWPGLAWPPGPGPDPGSALALALGLALALALPGPWPWPCAHGRP